MGRKKRRTVECSVEEVLLRGPRGSEIEGVEVTCPRCGERRTSFGTSDASVTRCLAMLANGCPFDDDNIYVEADND